jgi:malto-oligosyltrehalose trehalohydrolase
MKRKHDMPFGAEYRADGSVRFRLWAPGAKAVSLLLCGSPDRELSMSAKAAGWFDLVTSDARLGSRYQFKINSNQLVPDPASRFQPGGVHGPSEVIDPGSFEWQDATWLGRPWLQAVVYEMHVGTFTPEGTFAAAQRKLDYLADLHVTAVEIMPVSSFPGKRNWGYDGVLPYAPAGAYGRPEELKGFINAAHAKNLMVFLDVVYNHFGPEGNYLRLYAPQFFTDRHHTPWGEAINFENRTVRDFFIHNALYWLEEYHFDGLRFDAVHAIFDDSKPDILTELAETVRAKFGGERHIHLVLENDNNAAHYLAPAEGTSALYDAQWNDDIHHALHVLVTGEEDGYYRDYAHDPAWHLGRCLAEGFSYQGERSSYRGGEKRGEPSRELPASCFVSFLQNHDQVGNRALGERIVQIGEPALVKAAVTCLLLAPSPPLLFMAEEVGAATPFFFFCDFGPDLAPKVTEGRRAEFAKFARFSRPEAQSEIPDPNDPKTFLAAKFDWDSLNQAQHQAWRQFYRELLACRQAEIVPRISTAQTGKATFQTLGDKAVCVHWALQKGNLSLVANFADGEICITEELHGRLLYSSTPGWRVETHKLPAFTAAWLLDE